MNDEVKRPFLTHAPGAAVTDNMNIRMAGPRELDMEDLWRLSAADLTN